MDDDACCSHEFDAAISAAETALAEHDAQPAVEPAPDAIAAAVAAEQELSDAAKRGIAADSAWPWQTGVQPAAEPGPKRKEPPGGRWTCQYCGQSILRAMVARHDCEQEAARWALESTP
jgi:hypothetical protein